MYVGKNGIRYEGDYVYGYREGTGTLYSDDGRKSYQGAMKAGMPHGKGIVFRGNKEFETSWIEGIDSSLLP